MKIGKKPDHEKIREHLRRYQDRLHYASYDEFMRNAVTTVSSAMLSEPDEQESGTYVKTKDYLILYGPTSVEKIPLDKEPATPPGPPPPPPKKFVPPIKVEDTIT